MRRVMHTHVELGTTERLHLHLVSSCDFAFMQVNIYDYHIIKGMERVVTVTHVARVQ